MVTSRAESGASRAILFLAAGLVLLLAQTVSAQDNFASSFYNDKCPQAIGPDGNDRKCRCIRVRDYDDLRGAVRRLDDGECKCFEPFMVVKGPNDPPIEMDDMRRVTVMCQQFGSCIIQGPGTHFDIRGDESEVTLAGFRLMGATQSSIVVREDTGTDRGVTKEQVLCDIEFVGNQNDWLGGGALFVGPRSQAYVKNAMFMQNAAQRMGGAIYSESSLLQVVRSSFVSNYASIGGAVSSNMPDAQLILADNEFDRNVAGLGPTYGPAIAANGYVQDYGGNEADPKDFMCLHCKLNTGTRPPRPQLPGLPVYAADPNSPFVPKPEVEYVNIQRAKAGSRVDNGQRVDTDEGVDTKFELNRYRRYEDYQEEYELYPDDVIFGPFNIKLYFGKGYQWQEQYDDLNMCLESKYREQKVEGREEPLQLYKCDEDQDRQRFVAVGKTIRLDEDRTLCMTYIDVRKIELHKCTNSIYQQWDRLQADGKFRISPVTDHRRCMTNHHHPRNEERIYLEWCEIAEEGDTLYWEVKWMDGVAPDTITMAPTKNPTQEPTTSPTDNPTKDPTASPTDNPTVSPTLNPTFGPTISKMPTPAPSASPTSSPTSSAPTLSPTVSISPTPAPSAEPTSAPTRSPWDPNPEPQCGTQAGGALCTQSLFCCNAGGYCGLGTKYCGEGCQSGMFCANPVPAPAEVEEGANAEVELVDEDVVDIAVGAKPGHSFVIGSGGIDSINEESSSSDTVDCGDYVKYIKNGVIKGKACDDINPGNLCHRQLANGSGRVWDVCCDQCESLRNAAR